MAKKLMKRCPTSFVIICHYCHLQFGTIHNRAFIRRVKIQTTGNTEDAEHEELSFIVGGNAEFSSHLGGQFVSTSWSNKKLSSYKMTRMSNFPVDKPSKRSSSYDQSQPQHVNLLIIGTFDLMWWGQLFISVSSSQKHNNPSPTNAETPDESHSREILQNISPVLLRIVKVIKKKESLRWCHNQGQPKKIWQPNVKWDAETHPTLQTDKNYGNLNKYEI